jgi:hypothetical protein
MQTEDRPASALEPGVPAPDFDADGILMALEALKGDGSGNRQRAS